MFNEILIETNIDRLFDIFDKELKNIDNNSKLIDMFGDFLEENNIEIRFKENNELNCVRGRWGINPKTYKKYISIQYPCNINRDVLNKQTIRTLLHELVHVLNDNKIPKFITRKSKLNVIEYLSVRQTVNPIICDFKNVNINELVKYLEYVFHPLEKSNFALTIAISCYFDMDNVSPNIVFLNNKLMIKEYFAGKISSTSLNNYINFLKLDTVELFNIQLSNYFVKRKEYTNQLYSLLRLSIKYWKRLNKVLK